MSFFNADIRIDGNDGLLLKKLTSGSNQPPNDYYTIYVKDSLMVKDEYNNEFDIVPKYYQLHGSASYVSGGTISGTIGMPSGSNDILITNVTVKIESDITTTSGTTKPNFLLGTTAGGTDIIDYGSSLINYDADSCFTTLSTSGDYASQLYLKKIFISGSVNDLDFTLKEEFTQDITGGEISVYIQYTFV